jgi:uncharacterized protein YhbP (UPF0306 family)
VDDVRARMLAYLRDHITMTLATSRADQPRAATVFYANDGFDLYFISDPDSVHSQDLQVNPRVFVTVSQDYADWQAIQGIQLSGSAAILGDPAHAAGVYGAKFPFVAGFPAEAITYWKISPAWVRMVDNTLGFAHKDEFDL